MASSIRRLAWFLVVLAIPALFTAPLRAQTPGEISGVVFSDEQTLAWDDESLADHFNVYRGRVAHLSSGQNGLCHGHEINGTSFSTAATPEPGDFYFYLVTGESLADGEGAAGQATGGLPRTLLAPCSTSVQVHVASRVAYGADDWTRDRIAALGIDGYVSEQLDPASISELDNTELSSRLALYDPPTDLFDLLSRQVVSGVFARRQLEQQMAMFWANHFNTYWTKVTNAFLDTWYPNCPATPFCDVTFPQKGWLHGTLAQNRELETFRDLAFNGNFRQMVEASAKSPAMIYYLDGNLNIAAAPNENYARELLELYTMGVDGGYTQADVEELARILTGWTVCYKVPADLDDPLAACLAEYWPGSAVGDWTAHFEVAEHDCTAKTLFLGEPEEIAIPDTCSTPDAGVNDLQLALDGIVEHPSTAPFISRKILQLLVTDEPTQAMIDTLMAEWNDAGHPHGVGDLREVIRAALELEAFGDVAATQAKLKTPFEHFISAIRILRGSSDGVTALLSQSFPGKAGYLFRAQHVPFNNIVPTGYSELGKDWISTNSILERQNFGSHISISSSLAFGTQSITLLNDNGVSTTPGNAEAIVDFLSRILFGGNLPPADRQQALDFLLTANDGTPDPDYNDQRIRFLVGFLLGYPQFQKQ